MQPKEIEELIYTHVSKDGITYSALVDALREDEPFAEEVAKCSMATFAMVKSSLFVLKRLQRVYIDDTFVIFSSEVKIRNERKKAVELALEKYLRRED